MNGENNGRQVVEVAVADRLTGARRSVALGAPMRVPAGVPDPWTVCRMAVPRLAMGSLERIVLSLLVEDAFVHAAAGGAAPSYSYARLGEAVGRGGHSAKSAVAALRRSGLVATSRTARSGDTLSVSVGPLLDWAAGVCAGEGAARPETAAEPEMRRKASRTPQDRSAHAAGTGAEPPPPAPPAPSGTVSCAGGAACPAPDDGGDIGPAGPGGDGPLLVEFGPEVDASAEREATLRAAGRTGDEDSDEITFGSDTADSDIGTGIEINMDL